MLKEYVVVDLEMSGPRPAEDSILEIGAIKVMDGHAQTFQKVINPHKAIDPFIVKLTGITDSMARHGVDVDEAMEAFLEFAGDLPYVGHSIMNDYSFLKTWCDRHSRPYEVRAIDTFNIAKHFLPDMEKRSLPALSEYYGIKNIHAHRALDDARATQILYLSLATEFEDENLDAAGKALFTPAKLVYNPKKPGAITSSQIRYIKKLSVHHKLPLPEKLNDMTKSEASKYIDKIIRERGNMPKSQQEDSEVGHVWHF